jgi:hypothetical protein
LRGLRQGFGCGARQCIYFISPPEIKPEGRFNFTVLVRVAHAESTLSAGRSLLRFPVGRKRQGLMVNLGCSVQHGQGLYWHQSTLLLQPMTEPNEQYAYFTVTGDFDPSDISELVGVAPTECWRKGSVNPGTQLERTFSRWSLYSRLERNRSLEDHIADVIQQLRENRSGFGAVSSKYGGVMHLVAYFKCGYRGLDFDRELMKSLAEFSLSVDFDFYYLHSESREDS